VAVMRIVFGIKFEILESNSFVPYSKSPLVSACQVLSAVLFHPVCALCIVPFVVYAVGKLLCSWWP